MIGWFVDMMLATGLLMVLVLVIRQPVARIFGPRVAYALWALPAARMILPPLPETWAVLPSLVKTDAGQGGGSWLLPVLWLMGASLFFLWHHLNYHRFVDRVRADAQTVGHDDDIIVAQSDQVHGPLAFGLFQKLIMLPADFEARYSASERRLALAHETSHHRRGDLLANIAGLALLSLHWFNPIAHIAYRAFRADQEAACDATVLIDASDQDRADYGNALVKSALGPAPLMACRIGAARGVKHRLTHIVAARDTAYLHDTGLALVSIMVVAGLGFTASSRLVTPPQSQGAQLAFAHHAGYQAAGEAIIVADRRAARTTASVPLAQVDHLSGKAIIVRARTAALPVVVDKQAKPASLHEQPKVEPVQLASGPVLDRLPNAQEQTEQLPTKSDAPQNMMVLANGGCPATGSVIASQYVLVREGERLDFRITMCGPQDMTDERRAEIIMAGLTKTRDSLNNDTRLPEAARDGLVSAIDQQIQMLKDNEV